MQVRVKRRSPEVRIAINRLIVVLTVGLLVMLVMCVRVNRQDRALRAAERSVSNTMAQINNYERIIEVCHDEEAIRLRAGKLGMQEAAAEQICAVRLLSADERPTELIAANRRQTGITG